MQFPYSHHPPQQAFAFGREGIAKLVSLEHRQLSDIAGVVLPGGLNKDYMGIT